MPISTRGLGLATNATENLARLIASLGAQKAQGFRGIGDTARQIQQDAARRQAAEAAQKQRQQQIDLQQSHFDRQGTWRDQDQAKQQESAAALRSFVLGQIPQPIPQPTPQPTPQSAVSGIPGLGAAAGAVAQPGIPEGTPPAALMALLGNLYRQGEMATSNAFRGGQNALDREHQTGLAETRESGMGERLDRRIGADREMQDARHGHAQGMQQRDHRFRGVQGGLDRAVRRQEGAADRAHSSSEGAASRASSEKIAGARIEAAGSRGSAGSDSVDDRIKALQAKRIDILAKARAPMKSPTGEKPFTAETRSGLESVVKDIDAQIKELEGQKRKGKLAALLKIQELNKAGKPVPEALMREAGLAK